MKKRDALNIPLHLALGLAVAFAVCWSYWMAIPTTLVWAFLREQAQHRWIIEEHPAIGAPSTALGKRTFFDFSWLGWQQVFEIAQITTGSAVACGVWYFLH